MSQAQDQWPEVYVARHDGVCDLCGQPILADKDRIVHLEDDDCWVHEDCAIDEGLINEEKT